MKGTFWPAVLIVDDDADIRSIIRATLAGGGFESIAVANGKEALSYLRNCALRPRLILLDLMMPEMTGWEFLKIRQGDPALAKIPTAIITVLAGAAGQAPGLGVVEVVAKPSRVETLMPLVERFCGLTGSGRRNAKRSRDKNDI